MKYWILYIAIITLFAATVPCCSLADLCSENISQRDHTNQDDHNTCSNCSPFFACGSCSGCVLPSETIKNEITVTLPVERKKITHFKTITPFRILKCMWKPPRHNSIHT
ncbi:hypothetical protein [Pustulibacterium marinum]|uniref:hypothetical protein n=1 Tax=Pustulibacterium marinum TaxID=1224947 RepID=UPI000B882BFC|nr:hypothetical protein [Pustulibacterium marinum]